MNDNKKLIFKVEILAIVILTVLLICNIIILNNKQKKLEDINNGVSEQYEQLPDYIKTPKKSYAVLGSYYGDISYVDVYTALYELATESIPKYCKELKNKNSGQIESYYENNKEEIYKKLGLTNKEDFSSLVKEIVKLNEKDLEFLSYEFEKDSVKISGDETSANLLINYKNDDKIKINVRILSNMDKGAILKVTAIK